MIESLSSRDFIERLQIEKRGEVGYDWLYPWFDEQEFLWDKLHTRRKVLAIKPRRVGFTTLATAFFFEKAYRSTRGRRVLQVAHDADSLETLRHLVEGFHDGLPTEFQFGYAVNNNRQTIFKNNCAFERRLSGQHGKVRGKGFHDLHFTEAAFYSQRASRDSESDEDSYTSALAALDADDAHVLIESTGNGPQGLFHRLYRQAKDDPEWGLVFVPWTLCQRYQRQPPPGFEEDLDAGERKLLEQGVTLPQLAWRRSKLTTDGYTLLRFRREYPMTDVEPFLLDEAGWFDPEPLNSALLFINPKAEEQAAQKVLQIFHAPEPGRKYFQGVDSSGGTGGDYSVGSVWRDDLLQVAVWRSNRLSPVEQGQTATHVGSMYGALTLIEANHFGKKVIDTASALGCKLWKDVDGNDFWSSGRKDRDSKRHLYADARDLVAQDLPIFRHGETVREMMTVVEKSHGRIEAAGEGHDDCADAAVLAWYCGKHHIARPGKPDRSRERMWASTRSWRRQLGVV